MRGVVVLITLAACSGGSSSGKVCVPDNPAFWPDGCDTLDCRGVNCDVTCVTNTTCGTLDCTSSPQCRIDCQPGVTCEKIDCTNAQTCFVDCEDNANCDVTCAGAQDCVENCRPDTECLLRCGTTPQAQCHFDMCPTVTDCGNGTYACNRACP